MFILLPYRTFENMEHEKDTIIYFENGGQWHTHGDMFMHESGLSIESIPMYILDQLKKGELLICIDTFPEDQKRISFQDPVWGIEPLNPGERVKYIRII